jgi:hypothetical protein
MNLKGLLVEWGTSDKASINAAIEDIRNLGEINPFNSREVLIDNNVSVELSNFDGHLWINSIMTLERGRGDASRVLQKMCDIADKHQVYMGLGASPFGKTKGLNKSQLIAWYKRYGFKKVDYDTMERPPMPIREGKSVHDPVKPGILKQRLGSLSCSKVRSAKSKLKDKGTHYAKALQRYLNYHC